MLTDLSKPAKQVWYWASPVPCVCVSNYSSQTTEPICIKIIPANRASYADCYRLLWFEIFTKYDEYCPRNCRCDDIYFAIISFISHNFRISIIVALRSSWYVTTNKLLCETLLNRILAILSIHTVCPFFPTHYISLPWPTRRKRWRILGLRTGPPNRTGSWNFQLLKIQDGGRPPSWKSKIGHISGTVRPIFTKFGMMMHMYTYIHTHIHTYISRLLKRTVS